MAYMFIDCETLDLGFKTLAAITDSSEEYLKKYLYGLGRRKSKEALTAIFRKKFLIKLPERACWFHLTRVHAEKKFNEGLLPSPACVETIWNDIFWCLRETPHLQKLEEMRAKAGKLEAYNLKLQQLKWCADGANDQGPYGFLILPVKSKFFITPEIMQDICKDYLRLTGEDITGLINSNLQPKIVKFWGEIESDPRHYIDAIIYHLYKNTFYVSDPLDGNNPCYAGHGTAIPNHRILKIIELPKHEHTLSENKILETFTPLVKF